MHQNPTERSVLLSTYEALQLMLAFGSFLLTLISLVVAIVILKIKNNRLNFGRVDGYF
ncbi:TPA: putative holin-like toxin [Streptococcus equi subsp. zooepidemicus]|uniref:putative holin-like toxin n=1 Tax=Streptococcus equi TaxID=1336 RepID=UPI0022AB908B|nr:putative holin-like toxin [Streptococcus equi]MCD3466588.1 putative holin-like toxin [Streptococcus equi subsp. zooepidemicus]MCD3466882.1 putative holin-like toxin [Streptococcus equi subsp. zooepidemicus]MCD3466885.1 putative holin-like toxin [Streptococcus equi subsp. zooepidemicus]HEL0550070.1 putative holin-like toxin [Streptococcus equi subsp. zooepidemicus]HEL1063589.1 putative holin-like toxin [Streptococcus equi subsp. zooepidemicus]